MIERQIVIGLIVSTEFLQQVREIFNVQYLESEMARRLAGWCLDYFDEFNEAPKQHIQDIYYEKLNAGLSEEIANEIEEDILPDLNEEYIQNNDLNVRYLLKQTKLFLGQQHLTQHNKKIDALLDDGKVHEAEQLASDFKPLKTISGTTLDLNHKSSLQHVKKAFTESRESLIYYPRQLGKFWNNELIRRAFVVLMASEKRGKSYRLIEMALRAVKQGLKVAFFQAGDMTDYEQLRRIGINLTGKSNKPEHCGKMLQPVRDCIMNQLDTCNSRVRECDFGVFDDKSEEFIRDEVTIDHIREALKDYPDYKPCWNCPKYWENKWGAVWMKEIDVGNDPVDVNEVLKAYDKFFIKHNRNFRLETYPNGSLTLGIMNSKLDQWEKEGWYADVIALDYMDLLVYDGPRAEFRHQVDYIWKGCRGISQKRNALFISGTQSDAKSYDKKRLSLSNFSEDKRKYGHVTAMYGLNQDPQGREKKLGLMIINKLALREDEFEITDEVTVLQNLHRGRPFLGSYF